MLLSRIALRYYLDSVTVNGFVSSNVRYVTCSHGTDCHAESPSSRVQPPGGRGGGNSHTLPIRVCAAQRGRVFEAPYFERAKAPVL